MRPGDGETADVDAEINSPAENTSMTYHIAQAGRPFARTNRQTIQQRAEILSQLGYRQSAIAEICCGDGQRQQQIYHAQLQATRYCGLDISSEVVIRNRANGVACVQGDALDGQVIHQFLDFDVLFFGPPLSVHCDGHTGLPFRAITPGYAPFARLLLHEQHYGGLLVCIGPNSTNMGDIRWLYEQARAYRPDIGLRLIHYSYATLTGDDETTERRLKYVEIWLGVGLADMWEIRESIPSPLMEDLPLRQPQRQPGSGAGIEEE